jgi:hypothetical protein
MSSLENIYMKMSPALATADLANLRHDKPASEGQKLIGRDVAHELNNILTIIRGYSDRLVLKHGDHPTLRTELQLICDNARRAEMVIRNSARIAASPVVRVDVQSAAQV